MLTYTVSNSKAVHLTLQTFLGIPGETQTNALSSCRAETHHTMNPFGHRGLRGRGLWPRRPRGGPERSVPAAGVRAREM